MPDCNLKLYLIKLKRWTIAPRGGALKCENAVRGVFNFSQRSAIHHWIRWKGRNSRILAKTICSVITSIPSHLARAVSYWRSSVGLFRNIGDEIEQELSHIKKHKIEGDLDIFEAARLTKSSFHSSYARPSCQLRIKHFSIAWKMHEIPQVAIVIAATYISTFTFRASGTIVKLLASSNMHTHTHKVLELICRLVSRCLIESPKCAVKVSHNGFNASRACVVKL